MHGDLQPARLGRRLIARVMDLVTLLWLSGFVLVEIDQRLLGGDPFGERPLAIDVTSARSLALVVLVIVAYEVVPVRLFGATLGKAMTGLRVWTLDGDPVPAVLGSVRALVLFGAPVAFGAYGGVVLLVLLVSVVVPRSGRGLHDRAAATQVVQAPETADGEGSLS